MDFQFKKKAFRNYMRPTRSSYARRWKLQARVNSPASSSPTRNYMSASVKKFPKVSSCVKKSVTRATCSSTLKHYKPKQGDMSKMRVCPSTCCSLKGHIHEISDSSLPIKCFVSKRRRILKNLRSEDIKTLFLGKIGDNEEDEKVAEEGVNEVITEIPSDLFAEIDMMSHEEMIEEKNCVEINIKGEKEHEHGDCSHVLDQTSGCSGDELDDVMENLLEYVEVDDEKKAREIYHFEENRDTKNSDIESMEMDCEAGDDSGEEGFETEHSSPAILRQSEDVSSKLEAINETKETLLNASDNDLSSKWNITRKIKTTEELEQAKQFNPKPPNFLPLELDPEAEKVDLRHQMMDERRNSEEWMIDYALQNALARLGDSDRKKKTVSLLVKAFEAVLPNIIETVPSSAIDVISP